MSDLTNPNQLEAVIDQLDQYLVEGWKLYKKVFSDVWDGKKKPDFDQSKYHKEIRPVVDKWHDEVAHWMEDNLKRRYHIVHFTLAVRPAMGMYDGMNMEMSGLIHAFQYRLNALEDVILRLVDERNLTIRQEIADKEHQAGILYKVAYSDHSREIKVNDLLIAKPDFAKENEQFFGYLFQHPNRKIERKEIEEATNIKLQKTNSDIVSGLGFTGPLRQIFWAASKTHV